MKNRLKVLLWLLHLVFASVNCLSQTYESEFDRILTSQFSAGMPGGTALVAKEGKVIYRRSFGKANLELDVAMTANHAFRIGSITKQFTASAILKLAEENKLSLQDSITKFIKDYPTHGYKVTIEHLLTHTSGIKNYTSLSTWTKEMRRKDLKPRELIDFFKDEPMDFIPGEDYRYSNSGYVLLGYIIERISGKSYAQYIEENFFHPLGMENSFYDRSSTLISKRAAGYQRKNGHYENADFVSMTLPYSAGGLVSTVDDLFAWYEAVMDGKVVSKKSFEKAHTSYTLNNGRLTGYGYGWGIGNIQGSSTIKHDGKINGFVTYAVYIPADKIFVVIFSNCDCTDNLEIPASRMAAIILGKPYAWNRIELAASDLETYQGFYKSEHGVQKIVAFENERLLIFDKGGRKSQLIPFEKDKFFLENTLVTMEFVKNAAGDIVSLNSTDTGIPVTMFRTDKKIETIKAIKIASHDLEKYAGEYQFSPGMFFSVVREGDKLYGQVGQDKKEILPFGRHKFFARDIDARIVFNLDRNGNVVSLTKIQSDAMDAMRIK